MMRERKDGVPIFIEIVSSLWKKEKKKEEDQMWRCDEKERRLSKGSTYTWVP